MRQVILQIDLTLDGFIAGPNGEMDWIKVDEEMNQDANLLLRSVDTILLGRVAYQLFADYWPSADTSDSSVVGQIARQLNQAPKVVFSRTLDRAEWGNWNNVRLVKENVGQVISEMKGQPGKDLVLYAGADIISTFMDYGLIDEYRLRVHPVILGSGKLLFKDIKARVNLKLLKTKTYPNGAVLLDYQPGTI